MYYVLDGTQRCGLYECSRCHDRFLDARIVPKMICPGCGEPSFVIEGEENVARYDALLSLAVTGGNYDWI